MSSMALARVLDVSTSKTAAASMTKGPEYQRSGAWLRALLAVVKYLFVVEV